MKTIFKVIKRLVFSIGIIYALNVILSKYGVFIPINITNIGISGILGIPGIFAIYIINLIII